MNSITRFWKLGVEDADRRLAAALTPVPTASADRYLKTSAVVIAVDRLTQRLREWLLASEARHVFLAAYERVAPASESARSRAIAIVIFAAVATHLVMTAAQGTRPGWFWIVIPSMAAAYAALLLAASRSSDSN